MTYRAMPFDGRICPLHDEAAEALQKRQTEARIARNRERLIGQGSVVERIADDRATYGGGPREIRE
jgi:hypothetical protein